MFVQFLLTIVLLATIAHAKRVNFLLAGGIPEVRNVTVANHNSDLISSILTTLSPGDVFYFPNQTFHVNGGIYGQNLKDLTFHLDGTLSFINGKFISLWTHSESGFNLNNVLTILYIDRETWPLNADGSVKHCFLLEDIEGITFTSSVRGTFDGNGQKWWGAIQFLKHQEDRPVSSIVHSRSVVNPALCRCYSE